MRSRLLLPALLVFCLTACASSDKSVDYPEVAKCGEPIAGDLIGIVTRVLFANGATDADPPAVAEAKRMSSSLGDAALNELDRLAVEHGPELIACLVDDVVQGWKSTASSATPDRLRSIERGQSFLEKKGARVEHDHGSLGFVPIERGADHRRPWHMMLGARGYRA
jgi:hypothetical protein